MANSIYRIYNGPMPTTGIHAYAATGTAIKTMLQTKSVIANTVVGWGYKLSSVPTVACKVELLTTGTVNATVTASTANDVIELDNPSGVVANFTYATSGTGYTSTAEGSIVATRVMDVGDDWATSYRTQYPLAREPNVAANDICRIRALSTVDVQMLCWIDIEMKQ